MLSYLNIKRLLLRGEGYPPAVLCSFGLHALVIFLMLDKGFQPADMVDLDKPSYVTAAVVQQNPQRLRRLENNRRIAAETRQASEQKEQREKEAATKRQEETRAKAQQEEIARLDRERVAQENLARDQETAQRLDREKKEKEQRDKTEQERLLAEEIERVRQENLAREQAQREAQQVAAAQAADAQAASDSDSMQAYKAIIFYAIANNWIRPPSARNGLTVVIRLRLVPTGEIISSEIVSSSGNAAFDRSATQAVARTERFPELQEMPTRLFDSQFRTVTLTFRPEDLLR